MIIGIRGKTYFHEKWGWLWIIWQRGYLTTKLYLSISQLYITWIHGESYFGLRQHLQCLWKKINLFCLYPLILEKISVFDSITKKSLPVPMFNDDVISINTSPCPQGEIGKTAYLGVGETGHLLPWEWTSFIITDSYMAPTPKHDLLFPISPGSSRAPS